MALYGAGFDTASGGSITIGTGKASYDSIASDSENASSTSITKTGEGTLTANSSMASYFGSLNVDGGTMSYTNTAGLGSTDISIGDASSTASIAESCSLTISLNSSNT